MESDNPFFGKPGEPVPVVPFEDLKKAWEFTEELNSQHPGEQYGIGMGLWEQVLPGANIAAVTYRRALVGLLEMKLKAAYPGGKISDHALKVAAEIEVKWIPVGAPQEGSVLNEEEFLARVWGMSMTEKN